jgi:hypothetical protein
MPFQEGIFKLAFWALQDVLAATENDHVLLVPMGIHYVVSEERAENLHVGLTRLERALFGGQSGEDPLTRIRRICYHLLEALEGVYYGATQNEMSISNRTTSLRTDMLEEMERFLQLHPRGGDSLLDRARAVRNRLDEEVYADTESTGQYAQAAHERRVERLHGFYDAVKRVCAFDAVDILTVDQDPSLSTLFEMLWMLETEVFGAPKSLVPRTAEIRVGDPVLLNDHYEAYLDDKRGTVEHVTQCIGTAVAEVASEGV